MCSTGQVGRTSDWAFVSLGSSDTTPGADSVRVTMPSLGLDVRAALSTLPPAVATGNWSPFSCVSLSAFSSGAGGSQLDTDLAFTVWSGGCSWSSLAAARVGAGQGGL